MTVKELRALIDNLEEYTHVPGGVDKLKKAVLHLAVSGQLVPQDPSEGTGEQLYRQIQSQKAELIKQGEIRYQKTLPEITSSEIPFEIPMSWHWVRLGNLAKVISKGTTPSGGKNAYCNEGVGFIRAENVTGDRFIDTSNLKYVTEEQSSGPLNRSKLRAYDLLVCIAGTLGRTSVVPASNQSLNCNQAVSFTRFVSLELLDAIYFQRAISSIEIQKLLLSTVKTTAIPNLTLEIMSNCIVPLPPTSEQKRIVAKVDSIFALIDRLVEAHKSEHAERGKLTTSSLTQLTRGKDDAEKSLALTHLSEIIRTKADSQILRQTILQLAVSGRLVPQDPSEGTGEDLYQHIQSEKAKLVKHGETGNQQPLSEISIDVVPFVTPSSWRWVRLPDIYSSVAPVTKVKSSNILESGQLPVVDQGKRYIAGYVNQGQLNSVEKPVVIFGDHTREIKLIDFDFIVGADGVKILEPILIDSTFFYFLIEVFRPQSRGYGRHFKMLNDKVVPLPPLAEQERIVTKTSKLLDLVTELEDHLAK